MTWSPGQRRWMRYALRLAACSLGQTAPNPGVGCVIVRDQVICGSGRHQRCGGPHAEVQALEDCRRRGQDPRGATVFVSLSPCTHYGRTPPCSQALIAAGVAEVHAAVADPGHQDVAQIFAAAGIRYTVGCEAAWAEQLHGGWLRRQASGLPRCTGKWAMSLDGFLSAGPGLTTALSSAQARALSRRRRRAFDAIVVGAGTASCDDPLLLAQAQRHPRRVVISARADLDPSQRCCQDLHRAPLWLLHDQRAPAAAVESCVAAGIRCVRLNNAHDPIEVLRYLGQEGCNEVLVEGGSQLHAAFLAADAYDRLEIYLAGLSLGAGLSVASPQAAAPLAHSPARWRQEGASLCLQQSLVTRWSRAAVDVSTE